MSHTSCTVPGNRRAALVAILVTGLVTALVTAETVTNAVSLPDNEIPGQSLRGRTARRTRRTPKNPGFPVGW
jgi:hypothetical protein